ncbi:MAG: RidA family protein [Gammaproteobacteria bacterium]
MSKQPVVTDNAPGAIGAYSQAIISGSTIYLSGQIPLEPATMQLVQGDIDAQIAQVFDNLTAVTEAAGGGLDDIVKLTVYLTDLTDFPRVNEVMAKYFAKPYPARAAIGVASLPMGASVEAEGIMVLA